MGSPRNMAYAGGPGEIPQVIFQGFERLRTVGGTRWVNTGPDDSCELCFG
jgi:hypothetical protein